MKARQLLLVIVVFVLIPLQVNTDAFLKGTAKTRHTTGRTCTASRFYDVAKGCGMPPSVTAPKAVAKNMEGSVGSKAEGSTQDKAESVGSKAEATDESEKAKIKTAYITIDDGPTRSITPQNLDTLKKYGVKATFFVLPKRKSDDLYKRILDEGHVIGNHSYSHNRRLVNGADENFKKDVEQAKQFVYDKFGYTTTVFRFPGGSMGYGKNRLSEKKTVLAELGYRYFDWDVSTGDTDLHLLKNKTQDEIVSLFVNNVIKNTRGRKKLIVLMHDSAGKSCSAKALPKIIEGLKGQGYTFDLLTNY